MTSTVPAVAPGACRRAARGVTAVVPAPRGRSRDSSRVSQDCDGWPQIQSLTIESRLQRGMISAMHTLPYRLLLGWSFNTSSYKSADRSAYTVVYTQAKKAS